MKIFEDIPIISADQPQQPSETNKHETAAEISSVDENYQEQTEIDDGFGHIPMKDMEEEESRQNKFDSDYNDILETIVRRQSVLAIHLDQLLGNDNTNNNTDLIEKLSQQNHFDYQGAPTTSTIPMKHASISTLRQRLEEYDMISQNQQPHLYIETQNLTKPKPATPLIHPSGVHTRTSSSGEFLRTQIEELKQIAGDDEILNPEKVIPIQGTEPPKAVPQSNQHLIKKHATEDEISMVIDSKKEVTKQHSRSQTSREKAKTISHQQPNNTKKDESKFVHRSVKSATTTAAEISAEIFDIKKTLLNNKKPSDADEEDDSLFIESINEPLMISPDGTTTPVSPYKPPSAAPHLLNHSDSFLVLPNAQQLTTQPNLRLNSPIKCTSLFDCQHHRAKRHKERFTYFRQRTEDDDEDPSDDCDLDGQRSLFDPQTFETMFGNQPISPSILGAKTGTDPNISGSEKEISVSSSEEFVNEKDEMNEKMENIKAKLFDCVF